MKAVSQAQKAAAVRELSNRQQGVDSSAFKGMSDAELTEMATTQLTRGTPVRIRKKK